MAESILKHLAKERGLSITVDSAGTGSWHAGEQADPRTIATLRKNNIPCTSIARQLTREDFTNFDILFGMDSENVRNMKNWPGAIPEKVRLFANGIGDPYYGGHEGFDIMYHDIEAFCNEILDGIESKLCAN